MLGEGNGMKARDNFFSDQITQSERYLHTPGRFARENLLYVQEIGKLKSLVPHNCVREKLNSFLFIIVISGSGSLTIENEHYEMQKGDCVLLDCMKHYEHISKEQDGWELMWVHFNGKMARAYYNLYAQLAKDTPVFKAKELNDFISYLYFLMEKQKGKDLNSELHSGERLLTLLNRIIDNVTDNNMQYEEHEIMSEVREYLNEYYADDDILSNLSERFRIQELENKFHDFYGIDIQRYIWNRRLNSAKELLRFSVKSMEEVAVESGIKDLKIMKEMFIEEEGMSPEEYRMKWAQWIRK